MTSDAPGMQREWQIWIDRGGTFTDIVARAPDGRLVTHKLLSVNPGLYEDAAVQGIREILEAEGSTIASARIDAIKMGTTVATNALLERKGTPTVLAITEGFRDLLRIGYQNRPRLFDLDIRLPDVFYEATVEIAERLSADGTVLMPLNRDMARARFRDAHAQGYRSIAIALLHGYRKPDHERALGEIAREVGFTQITLSHEASPLIKIIDRASTAVVDAYLTPTLRAYVDTVSREIGTGRRLMFMTSNGGLSEADRFQGRDAILSGPAGGVVGAVQTAAEHGIDRLIGFDMGGTSTDVCHYSGTLERTFESEVAGARIRAPMMALHTVAAGGGSIVGYRDGRLQVGPESAGADPGPACYRRGGPLTVTDCNVLLGKLQPAHFPSVFGPNGDEPLDAEVVQTGFATLAEEVPGDWTPETLAEGFLRIAVENMANAIKKISVQRGYDVTGYVLNAFGGAGGQHACLVADALGIGRILIHPHAGVLSALGIGLADVRSLREAQFDGAIDDPEAEGLMNRLCEVAQADVANQGVPSARIETLGTAHVKVRGAHRALAVPFASPTRMRESFEVAHKAWFGFSPDTSALEIDMLEAEAIGRVREDLPPFETTSGATPPTEIRAVFSGEKQTVPLYERPALSEGQTIPGPAIIREETGTSVVEPGWQATCARDGSLLLNRTTPLPGRAEIGTAVDPLQLEIFSSLFMSIADQMGATLANTAHSVNIKERLDFSCALFDAQGNLVANAPHVPVHLGSMSDSVRTVLAENAGTIKPGDSFMLNDPYNGGTHLPDVTVVTPVFDTGGEEILFVVASRGHHADIGGKTPGSAPPDSRTIEEEGVLIRNFKLVDRGNLREAETRALLSSGPYPCRNVAQNMADLAAQLAANTTGVSELRKAVAQFGRKAVEAYMGHVQDNAEACVQEVLSVLKSARFSYPLDEGARIEVAIRVDQEARTAEIDFTGTSPQDPGNYNAPLSVCKAVTLYVLRTLVGKDIPMNEGCLRPITLIVPEGTMLNPRHPAAVISGNTEVSQAVADTLFGALGVIAGSQGTMNNFVWGNESFQNYETIGGGTGAGPDFDGASAVHSHMTNTRLTDPEVLETRFPVRVEEFSIRSGSGGAGRHVGGDGIVRRLRFDEPVTATVLTSHRVVPPHGADGGEPGATGENRVERSGGTVETLRGNDQVSLAKGDVFTMLTPGGGGFGPPEQR